VIPAVAIANMESSLTINQQTEITNASSVSKRNAPPQELKLQKAAAEFESILLSSFWKSMMETFSSDDDSDDPGHSTFQDMGIQAMSQAMGKAGGLGLGRLLVNHLEHSLEKANQIQAPQSP
jgi:Rod binding domain-containing protein